METSDADKTLMKQENPPVKAPQKGLILLATGTCIALLGEVFHIVGLGSTRWMVAKNIRAEFGLFQRCIGGIVYDIEDPSSALSAVRAMAIIGMLCGAVAVAAGIFFVVAELFDKNPPKLLIPVCRVTGLAAGLLIIIGIIVYGGKTYQDAKAYHDLGYSFVLSVIGGLLLPVGGVLVHFGGHRDSPTVGHKVTV